MKAFILAAGNGSRLRPLTDTMPKCLVPVRNMPLLQIWLDLCRLHGIKEVLVNAHSHSAAVKTFLQSRGGSPRVILSEETELLGSAGTLRANQEWVASTSSFWVLYADVLTHVDLTRMLHFHNTHDVLATMGVYTVERPQECGIVSIDDRDIVAEFAEKPARPAGNLAFSGVLLLKPAALELIPSCSPADIGFHLLPRLVGNMAAYRISEYLVDVGTPAAYEQAQLTWPGLHPA